MTEFVIEGITYRSRKMVTRTQAHVAPAASFRS